MSSFPLSSMCMMVPVAAAAQGGIAWQPVEIAPMHPLITQPDGIHMGSDQPIATADCAQWAQPHGYTWIYDGQQACQQAAMNTTTSGMEAVQDNQGWAWSAVPYMSEAHPHADFYDWHSNKTWTKPRTRNSKSWCKETGPQVVSFDAEVDAIRQKLRLIRYEAGSEADAENIMVNDLLRQVNAGEETLQTAMKQFLELAFFSSTSSRAAQNLLSMSEVSDQQKARLALSLRGHILQGRCAVDHPHANHVVQKIVEALPHSRSEFIVQELLGSVHRVAKHHIGCRTLCRILEHRPTDVLVSELISNVEELCRHNFGGYVVRKFLEHGNAFPMQKHQVALVLSKYAAWYAKQRMSSFVMEAAIEHCEDEDQRLVAAPLLSDRECVKLSDKTSGFHVLKASLLSRAMKQETSQVLERVQEQLAGTTYGKKLLQLLA